MTGINFLSENLIDEGELSITTGAENAQFPLLNLKNISPSVKFRSAGNSVVIEVDLLQTRAMDTVAMVGDPTDAFEVTAMSIKTSVTNDFSGSPQIDVDLSADNDMGWKFFDEVSHRYVQITITGSGAFCEVGRIFIGKRLNIPQNSFSINGFQYYYNDNSVVRESDYDQPFINERPLTKRLVGRIEYATKDETEEIDNLIRRHGRHQPLWVILDPDSEAMNNGKYILSMYGRMIQVPRWTASGGQLYNATISLRQMV